MKPKLVKLLFALTEMKRNSYEFSIDFLLELVYSIKKNNNKLENIFFYVVDKIIIILLFFNLFILNINIYI